MDNFADVLSGVEYFLERYSDSPHHASADLLTCVKSIIHDLTQRISNDETIEAEEQPLVDSDPLAVRYDDVTGIEEAQQLALQQAEDELELATDVETSTVEVDTASQEPTSIAPAAPQQAPAATEAEDEDEDEDDLIDEEIIEIFLEEAEEVTETIHEFWPQYKANHEDAEAFSTVRRAFHTLKGSGRMVKAAVIGELAWSIENLFNRVLDNSIDMSANIIDLTDHVISQIPALIEDFRKRQAPSLDTQPLMDYAHALAAKEPVADFSELVNASSNSLENEDIEIELPQDSAEPSAETSVELTGEDEADSVLIDIFIAETQSHLAEILIFIDESKQVLFSNALTDQLQRALHTIKGSAHMAGINCIANIAHPLEKLIKELRSYQVSNNEAIVTLVARGYEIGRAH